MKNLAMAAVGCAAFLLAGAAYPPSDKRAVEAKYEKLFDSLWTTVGANFYDPSYRGADWNHLGRKYRPLAARARNDADFLRVAQSMMNELKSSHLDVMPPKTPSPPGSWIAVKIVPIEGRRVIAQISPLSDAKLQGIRRGDVVRNELSSIPGSLGSTATVEVEQCNGVVRTVNVKREEAFWPVEQPTFRWSTITKGPVQKIGYLRVDGFGDDGAQLADQAMSDLADASALIVDLRYNSGGNASALRLASYFTDGARPGIGLLMRDWLVRLGRPVRAADVLTAPKLTGAYTTDAVFKGLEKGKGAAMLWTEDVGQKRWKKPVIVLQGENTGSAAEGFAWLMRLKTRATLIGRDTAGALLGSQVYEIGSGWSVRVPVHGIWASDGEDYGDRPVPPHIRVNWTRADLCSGRDPDLEMAIQTLAIKD